MIVLSATEVVLASITLFAVRHVWGSAFTYEKEVVTYVAEITPILCISIIMDGTQAVLSGYLFVLISFICILRIISRLKELFQLLNFEIRKVKLINEKTRVIFSCLLSVASSLHQEEIGRLVMYWTGYPSSLFRS